MQRLLAKYRAQLVHLDTLEGRLRARSQWPDDDADRGDSQGDRDPRAHVGDQHGCADADAELEVDPNCLWDDDLASVSVAPGGCTAADDDAATADSVRGRRAELLSLVTDLLEWMRFFGQVIAVTSALKFVHSQGEHSGNGRVA